MSKVVFRRVNSLEDRIKAIHEMIEAGLRDTAMRKLALQITRQCKARDDECELRAIYEWVKGNVRYTGDIAGTDTYQSAMRSIEFGGGDCDDHFVTNATLAVHNGFGVLARVTSQNTREWQHIYCVTLSPKFRPAHGIALDTTLPAGILGQEPSRIARYRDFRLY